MGQRLNIEICFGDADTCLANSYYHWSAYSSCTMSLLDTIMKSPYFDRRTNNPDIETAVKLLLATGAGFNDEEMSRAQAHLPAELCKPCTSRNEGLLSISSDGIEETREWGEARVWVYLDSSTADVSNIFYMVGQCSDIFADELEYNPELAKYKRFKIDATLDYVDADDIVKLKEYIKEAYRTEFELILEDSRGNLYTPIE